jgi:hypothetical protein
MDKRRKAKVWTHSLTTSVMMEDFHSSRSTHPESFTMMAAMDKRTVKYGRASKAGEEQEASSSGPPITQSHVGSTSVKTNSSGQGYWRAQALPRQRTAEPTQVTSNKEPTTRLQRRLQEICKAAPNKSTRSARTST